MGRLEDKDRKMSQSVSRQETIFRVELVAIRVISARRYFFFPPIGGSGSLRFAAR